MKPRPIDIWTALDYPDWTDGFFWPVDRTEVIAARHAFEEMLFRLYRGSSLICRPLISVAYNRLVIEYLSFFEALLTRKRFQELRVGIRIEKRDPLWDILGGLLNSGVPERQIYDPSKIIAKPFVKNRLKRLLFNLSQTGTHFFRKGRAVSKSSAYCMPGVGLVEEILTKKGYCFHRLDPSRLFSQTDQKLSTRAAEEIGAVTRKVVDEVLSVYISCGDLQVDDLVKAFLTKVTGNYLGVAASLRSHLQRLPSRILPSTVYAGTGKHFGTRLIGSVLQERGGELVCTEHGEGHGIYADTEEGYGELGLVNRYITYTEAMAQGYRDGWPKMIHLQDTIPQIGSSPVGGGLQFRTIYERFRSVPPPRKVKTVLYVAGGFRNDFTHIECRLPDMIYLEWQKFLFTTLRKGGYDVLCKYHPQTILKDRAFEPFRDVTYLYGNFIEHLEIADLIIFDYSQSTAFAIALCTNLPVILVHNGFPLIQEKAKNLMLERCAIIKGFFDDRNRFRIPKELLWEAIRGGLKGYNYDYVREYQIGHH